MPAEMRGPGIYIVREGMSIVGRLSVADFEILSARCHANSLLSHLLLIWELYMRLEMLGSCSHMRKHFALQCNIQLEVVCDKLKLAEFLFIGITLHDDDASLALIHYAPMS